MVMGFDLVPHFDIGFMKFFLNMGVKYIAREYKKDFSGDRIDDTSKYMFNINPFIEKTVGSGSFFAGFKMRVHSKEYALAYNNPGNDITKAEAVTRVDWSVPIGINYSF
jgi:hypothetical protein